MALSMCKLVVDVCQQFVDFNCDKVVKIVKIHDDKLSDYGELSFPLDIRAWKGFVECCEQNGCNDILQHLLCKNNMNFQGKAQKEIHEMALQHLKSVKSTVRLRDCKVMGDRVYLFLDRQQVIAIAVKSAITEGEEYGKPRRAGKLHLEVKEDQNSELTNLRLELLTKFTRQVLRWQGYEVSDESNETSDKDNNTKNYVFTANSNWKESSSCEKLVCAVVSSAKEKKKDTETSLEEYFNGKMTSLKIYEEESGEKANSQAQETIANAIVAFEMLSLSPARTILVSTDPESAASLAHTKEASFILYNVARIEAILEKYSEDIAKGKYPSLSDVSSTSFSCLNLEEEWELIFCFVVGYADAICESVKLEPTLKTCPQMVCNYLTRLCRKFSCYYRKVRVLTGGQSHMVPTMEARVQLLKALNVVLKTSLGLLGINSLQHM